MLWFVCNLFKGYKDNYAKQAGEERLKLMLSWPMKILNHYPPTLCYSRPYKFSKKKRFLPKEMKPSKSARKEKIGKDKKRESKKPLSAHAWTFKADI